MVTTVDPTGPPESHTLLVTVESTGMFRALTNLTVRVKSTIGIVVILMGVLAKEIVL
jgi:hypothetical protein|tara:strand:- start:502 stop:672 length:171 start_codon:yes stop_codon:yes gene_type:complete